MNNEQRKQMQSDAIARILRGEIDPSTILDVTPDVSPSVDANEEKKPALTDVFNIVKAPSGGDPYLNAMPWDKVTPESELKKFDPSLSKLGKETIQAEPTNKIIGEVIDFKNTTTGAYSGLDPRYMTPQQVFQANEDRIQDEKKTPLYEDALDRVINSRKSMNESRSEVLNTAKQRYEPKNSKIDSEIVKELSKNNSESAPEDNLLSLAISSLLPALAGITVGGISGLQAGSEGGKNSISSYDALKKSEMSNYKTRMEERSKRMVGLSKLADADVELQKANMKDEFDRQSKAVDLIKDVYGKDSDVYKHSVTTLNDLVKSFEYAKIPKTVADYAQKVDDNSIKLEQARLMGEAAYGRENLRANADIDRANAAAKAALDRASQDAETKKKIAEITAGAGIKKAEIGAAGKVKGSSVKSSSSSSNSDLIPNWTWNGKTPFSKTDLSKMQRATSDADQLVSILRETQKMIREGSVAELANPFSEKSSLIENYITDAQLLYKNEAFANLGVLTGNDEAVMKRVLENPNIVNMVSKGGKDALANRFDDAIKRIESGLERQLGQRGFKKTGEKLTGYSQDKANKPQKKDPQIEAYAKKYNLDYSKAQAIIEKRKGGK